MNNKELMEKQALILFDGECNLCNGFIQFVIERDNQMKFMFASLQSEKAKKILQHYELEIKELSTIYLLDNSLIYSQSTAILKIFKNLKGGWSLLYPTIIFPKIIRDKVYSFISVRRYSWFGKQEVCWIPTPELQERFL